MTDSRAWDAELTELRSELAAELERRVPAPIGVPRSGFRRVWLPVLALGLAVGVAVALWLWFAAG